MPKLSDKDFLLFHKLSSAHHAVSISATDPITLETGLEEDMQEMFGRIFYDCYENERVALYTMRSRINACAQDIASHYTYHKNMLEAFYAIEERANTNNRKGVLAGAADLCMTLISYSEVILLHHQKLQGSHISPFLLYPRCPKGHYFHIPGYRTIMQNSFNPASSSEGFREEIDSLILLLEAIGDSRRPLQGFKLTNLQDSGEGINDSSLRGRLELTKELLLRVGFVVQPSD